MPGMYTAAYLSIVDRAADEYTAHHRQLGNDPSLTIRAWSRVVRDGGALVFVDHGHPHEASRRALCGGLCEIEQRRAGRAVITSGLVSHFA